jgi:hypothetical protein
MATFTNDDPHEIHMDSGSEDDSEMDIDEVYSSDVDSNESDDELVRKEQSVNRTGVKLLSNHISSISTNKPVVFHQT